jgi:hypothetical protein
MCLQEEFTNLIQKYFGKMDTIFDWERFDFSDRSVAHLRACVDDLKRFSMKFTRMDNPDLNHQTVDIMHAIEVDIRRRSFREQYPEVWEPLIQANESLKHANETLKQTNATMNKIVSSQQKQDQSLKDISGWQAHFDKHLESVFTNIALEYLRTTHPENEYLDVFQEEGICQNWPEPNAFELDGLIYDKTCQHFYMVESKYFLTDHAFKKTENTLEKFEQFLAMDKPQNSNDSRGRKLIRQWDDFFDTRRGFVKQKQEDIPVSVFLGFHSIQYHYLVSKAKAKNFILIGPQGSHYKMLEYDDYLTSLCVHSLEREREGR